MYKWYVLLTILMWCGISCIAQEEPSFASAGTSGALESKADSYNTNSLFRIKDHDIVIGDRHSDVVVIEYSSFSCPSCAYYHKKTFPEIQKLYIDTKKIAYVIREFVANKQDMDGAVLARCAHMSNMYHKMLEVLFDRQENWVYDRNHRDILANIGQLGGISLEKYQFCLNDQDIVRTLIDNRKEITKSSIFQGTPLFIINGKSYGAMSLVGAIDKAIKDALKTQSK